MRACPCCDREIENDFRFCPGCGAPQRVKVVEYFSGHPKLDDGGLRVSIYMTPPQHARFSIWRGDRAEAVLSLDPAETVRLARFLGSLRRSPRTHVGGSLVRSASALRGALAEAVRKAP